MLCGMLHDGSPALQSSICFTHCLLGWHSMDGGCSATPALQSPGCKLNLWLLDECVVWHVA